MLQSYRRIPQVSSPRREGHRHPSHLRGVTRFPSLLGAWKRIRQNRGGTTLSSSVAWELQGAHTRGLPNLKGVRKSHPSHLVDRPVHPLHLHTLRGSPRMASSSCQRRRRNSLVLRRGLWQTSILTTKLSTHWVLARTYIICWGTLDGYNCPTGCRQTPTKSLPWKFWWRRRLSLMRGAKFIILIGGNWACGSLWAY
jgi:hypothetical protein